MDRVVRIGAAQLGPVARRDDRHEVVQRMVSLLDHAAEDGCDLVVFPELALTTFFPRWAMDDQEEIDSFFEAEMPGPATQALFTAAKRHGIGFCLGFAELVTDSGGAHRHYNTALLVDAETNEVGRYRKVHLPGHDEPEPWRPFQHLEKRYFDVGPDGFQTWRAFGGVVGMAICNDRRWPETYRVLALRGAEVVLIGYNTPVHNPPAPEHDALSDFHNHLVMQAGAYQNGMWVVGVAKAGDEEGVPMIGGTAIIAPSGEIVSQASTLGDELVVSDCDLDACASYRTTTFDFERHRRPEHYEIITTQRGSTPPD
ncbi:MAG: N-carbamoyl-D-amino-acid hydrolase [Acidimicrobiia bacterium]|nr:N-carbamoyl-D-amino-acid hydrolase [Acidimicrobiia bacterium]